MICHVARDDLVVFSHPLDHEVLDQLANAQLEFVERVCERRLDDLIVLARLLLDLLEKEAVFIREMCAKELVQDLDDLGERRFLIFRFAGPHIGGALDRLRFTLPDLNGTRVETFQPVVLKSYLIANLDDRGVTSGRQLREQESPIALQHLQVRIGIGDDLAQERVQLHGSAQFVAKFLSLFFLLKSFETVYGRCR
jgi:hypothetical protein